MLLFSPFLFSWISELMSSSVIYIAISNSFSAALIKEGHSKRMGIQGTAPPKTMVIQSHFHLSTNKQWLADCKILHISSTFSNIAIPFMKSIS